MADEVKKLVDEIIDGMIKYAQEPPETASTKLVDMGGNAATRLLLCYLIKELREKKVIGNDQ
jgi:hypothetical protein